MTRNRRAIWLGGRDREGVRFEAPAEYGQAWVRLRPLTWREALEREALACTEEFELDAAGVVQRVIRRFDAEAARRFELRRCLVGWYLPEAQVASREPRVANGAADLESGTWNVGQGAQDRRDACPTDTTRAELQTASLPDSFSEAERGDIGSAGRRSVAPELVERLLEGLAPGMVRWLESCLEEINRRRPVDREALEDVKKS